MISENQTGMLDSEFLAASKLLEQDINQYYELNEIGDLLGLAKYLVNLGYWR